MLHTQNGIPRIFSLLYLLLTHPPQKENTMFRIPAFHALRAQIHFPLGTYPIRNDPIPDPQASTS